MQNSDDLLKAERGAALAALKEICCNRDSKPSDRIAAARLLLEYGGEGMGSELHVIMDVPKEYLV